jgi:hypothetical protein
VDLLCLELEGPAGHDGGSGGNQSDLQKQDAQKTDGGMRGKSLNCPRAGRSYRIDHSLFPRG